MMRIFLGYFLYGVLLILIFGGIFLGTEFYPDETNVGMVAFVALCALWKVATVAWGFWSGFRQIGQDALDERFASTAV